MNVDTAKQHRTVLEQKIADMLREYEEKTGCVVQSVSLERVARISTTSLIFAVTLDIKLGRLPT